MPTGTGTPTVPAAAVEPALRPRLEAPVRENPPTPIEPVPEAPLTIMLSPRRDCWVSLRLDGELVVRRVMRTGERESYGASDEIILNVGDAGAFAFAINQHDGRSLGAAGQVVTVAHYSSELRRLRRTVTGGESEGGTLLAVGCQCRRSEVLIPG